MASKTYEEWVAFYEKKTGEKFERGGGYATFFFPDRGFCEMKATRDMIIVNQLVGDGKFWRQVAEVLAKERGYHHLGTWAIRRNILAYIRFWGFYVERIEELPDGKKRYFCKDKEGKKGLVSPAFCYESGRQAYFVTWEV